MPVDFVFPVSEQEAMLEFVREHWADVMYVLYMPEWQHPGAEAVWLVRLRRPLSA